MKLITTNTFKVLKTTSFVVLPIILLFIINNILLNGYLNRFGIHPRCFDILSIFEISLSWLLHANFEHLFNNMTMLIIVLPFISLFERKPLITIFELIAISGLFTWALGSSSSIHIGASGLIFSIFGYIFCSFAVGKRFMYSIPIVIFLLCFGTSFYTSILGGLIPKDGVSFAAHFGGLLGGFLISWLNLKFNKLDQ